MNVRKIIKFGSNSFVVSVPKSWVEKNNIKKGDMVYVKENGNNELVLTYNHTIDQKVKLRSIVINVDGKELNDVRREVGTAYVNNYHVIRIEGKTLDKKIREIRKFLSNLMALEVTEQTNHHIEARDFLNMKKISIPGTIKKIDLIVRSMLQDSKQTFENDSYDSILVRDDDVNRLVSLVVRVSRYALKKPHLIHDTGLTPFDFYKYLIVADALEKIGDEAKRICRYLRKLDLSEEEQGALVKLYSKVENVYLQTIEAFYTNDATTSLQLAAQDRKVREECDAFMIRHQQKPFVPLVMEKLKCVDHLVHTIGREVYEGDTSE